MREVSISPSLLDSFLFHLRSEQEDERFIERLQGFKNTEAMAIGTAFHAIIEHGADVGRPLSNGGLEVEGWEFDAPAVDAALAFRAAYPSMRHEVWGQLTTQLQNYRVESRLRVDGLHGLMVHEVKTTTSTYAVSIEDYVGAVQWRMYLLAFPHAAGVVYTKFRLKRVKETPRIKDAETHQFWLERHKGMENFVTVAMSELLDFMERRDLLHLLDRRQK